MFEKGLDIKVTLLKLGLSQVWLMARLRERGIAIQKAEMSRILNGIQNGEKADLILSKSVEILDDYEAWMRVRS